jgi:murein DD-endopeptidase MepM/ murein hydrolase activator NlpD
MDVITFLRPENHVAHESLSFRRQPSVHHPVSPEPFVGQAKAVMPRPSISFAALGEIPASRSFPVIFLLVAMLALSLTPAFQNRFGFYRLDRFSFPADSEAEAAMRLLVSPDQDADVSGDASPLELPASIRTVSYSTYKVRPGDTIGSILSRFGIRNVGTILSANRIDNVRRLRSGQTLSIPSMDGIVYTVSRGDSLARIAGTYKVPVTAILDANDLSDSILTAGEKLFIPGASLSANALRRAMGELFIYPIVGGRLTSRFGYRGDPFTGVRTFHTGIDLAAPTGTPIKACLGGKVITTGFSAVFGNYVILSHDGGYQTLYGHMSVIGAKKGDRVAQGTVIGKVGSTGYSTGSHVHLSVYKNGKMIDPLSMLK